jgi:hypothetical protein
LVIPGSKADWIAFGTKHFGTLRPERRLNPAEKKSLKNKHLFYSDHASGLHCDDAKQTQFPLDVIPVKQ